MRLTVIALLSLAVLVSLSKGDWDTGNPRVNTDAWVTQMLDSLVKTAHSGKGAVAAQVEKRAKHEVPRIQRRASDLFAMPVEGYINWGRTHTNTTGSPQNTYTASSHQSFLTVVHYVNNILGGMLINGSRYLINDINHNDGGDCDLMKIIYRSMVDVEGAQFLLSPVNPDCSVLSKFAESRNMIYMNSGDYSLLIERTIPNFTSAYDTDPWADAYSYADLQWTFNVMSDQSTQGDSCAEAMTNPIYIDQTGVQPGAPLRQVRTAAFASNEREVPYNVAAQRAALLRRNVTEPYAKQNLDLQRILKEQCAYLDDIVTDPWIAAQPDFAQLITGASNGSIGVTCLHKRHYTPPAFLSLVAEGSLDAWHTAGDISEVPFIASTDYLDPVFGSYSVWAELFLSLWGFTPTFYEDTFASSATVLLSCINQTQSLDSYVVRECLRDFNGSTVFGILNFGAQYGYAPNRAGVCVQKQTNGTFIPAYPGDYPGRQNLLIPYSPFPWNQTWLDQFKESHKLTKRDLVLIIVFSVLGFALVLAVVTALVIRKKYHMVFIDKSGQRGENWDDGSSQRASAFSRVLPCLRTD